MKLNKLSQKDQQKYKKSLNDLTKFIENKGFDVYFGPGLIDEILEDDKVIRINSNYRVDQQFFGLAHEIGHYYIRRNQKDFEEKYPRRARKIKNSKNVSRFYRYEEIKEELEAWRRAKNTIKRLGLFFKEKDFDLCEMDCVSTYIE